MLRRVRVEPLGEEETVAAMRASGARRRARGEPSLSPSAAAALVELCARYLPYEAFPGKAARVEEELCAERVRAGYDAAEGAPLMGADEVYTAFARRTGVPAFLLREDEALRREQITAHFGARVIGQAEAVGRVADALCVVKARAQPPGKPLATLLFVGPTGVGKTEVAKQLAVFLFGSPDRMARFDMSEYMDATAAGRLIRGVGRQSGELTRRVRDQPFGVVLLDEIEKAHPAVFDLLLQVLGEGRLSDARGETTYFHNAIIVMTSNLGAAAGGARPGFGAEALGERARYGEAVEKAFRPEFVNRLDAVVPFHALGQEEIVEVARVALDRAAERVGLAQRGVGLEVSEAARAWVARRGYSPELGARALARCLEDDLLTPASELISKAGGAARNGVVRVTAAGEERASASLGERERDGLVVALHGVAAKKGSEALRGLAAISDMRRRATRLRQTRWFVEVKGRIEFLLAQLNYGSRRAKRRGAARGAPQRAELLQQHHELSALWDACDEPFREIESYEELAVGALYDGEPFDWMEFECQQAWDRFGEHAVRVMLALWGNRDVTTLELRAARGPEALMRYTRMLAEAAEPRGWRVTFHLAGDSSAEWSGMGYGPPRDARWLAEHPDFETHCVLAAVSGPFAGALLDYEEGVHEWRGLPDTPPAEPPLVVVSVVGAKTSYAREDFVSKVVPTPPDHERDARTKRRRVVDMVSGDVSNPVRRIDHLIQAADYFLKYEAMVFEELVDMELGEEASS
jgi:ATP-dependent Clp protease ATP-binding subunit ClpC